MTFAIVTWKLLVFKKSLDLVELEILQQKYFFCVWFYNTKMDFSSKVFVIKGCYYFIVDIIDF